MLNKMQINNTKNPSFKGVLVCNASIAKDRKNILNSLKNNGLGKAEDVLDIKPKGNNVALVTKKEIIRQMLIASNHSTPSDIEQKTKNITEKYDAEIYGFLEADGYKCKLTDDEFEGLDLTG